MSSLYLTVKDGAISAGNDVILWDRKSELRDSNDQLWYIDDKTGTIRSALHDYCLDLNGNSSNMVNLIRNLEKPLLS